MTKSLNSTAQKLMEHGKGILAADESEGTIAKRFAKINLPNSLDLRRDYREMLFRSTDAMTNYISGVILTEETLNSPPPTVRRSALSWPMPMSFPASRSTAAPSPCPATTARRSPKASMACASA